MTDGQEQEQEAWWDGEVEFLLDLTDVGLRGGHRKHPVGARSVLLQPLLDPRPGARYSLAFYRLRNGTGHPGDFGWTPEPETGLPPQGQETAWLLPRKYGVPPVQHLPYWDEGPHTIGMPDDPMVRYLAFAATDRSGLYGLFTVCTPGPGYGRIGTFEEAGVPKLGLWPSFADYFIEVADALYENRGVEHADGHQDTKVPGLVDQALVWDGPAHPRDPDWRRFA